MLTAADVAHFHTHGYVVVRNFFSPAEVIAAQATFNKLCDGALAIPGKDRGERNVAGAHAAGGGAK
jgi:hypothetical protein